MADNDSLLREIASLRIVMQQEREASEARLLQEREASEARLLQEREAAEARVSQERNEREAEKARLLQEREAAEARVSQERNEREAEKARLLQEREAAEARVLQERNEREAEKARLLQKLEASEAMALAFKEESLLSLMSKFFYHMQGICSSSSFDTTANSDGSRRDAPEPKKSSLNDVLGFSDGMPDVSAKAIAAWNSFKSVHEKVWKAPLKATVNENKHVHPTFELFLRELVPSHLKLLCNAITVDDITKAEIRPDFSFSHVRDTLHSLIGAVIMFEVKLPGDIQNAVQQAIIYARRRVFKLYSESIARGESQISLHSLFAFAVATDGCHVVIVRVTSGAPPERSGYKEAVPCPAYCSPMLPMFGKWNFQEKPVFPENPPEAVFAMLRLLNLGEKLSGPGEPITNLSASITLGNEGCRVKGLHDDDKEVDDVPARPMVTLRFNLGFRLGLGGTSDVYVCDEIKVEEKEQRNSSGTITSSAGDSVGSLVDFSNKNAVLKVPRFTSKSVRESFLQEIKALQEMADFASATRKIPKLLGTGVRTGLNNWPVLLLEPKGTSLSRWIEEKSVNPSSSSSSSSSSPVADSNSGTTVASSSIFMVLSAREQLATAVALDVLDALEAAHTKNLIHCDVRPSNIVIADDDKAVLIDWGISRNKHEFISRCGVAAYVDERVFTQNSYRARPEQDLSALLCTWLSVVYSPSCTAPWLDGALLKDDNAVFAARNTWLDANIGDNEGIEKVIDLLRTLYGRERKKGGQEKEDKNNLYSRVREALKRV